MAKFALIINYYSSPEYESTDLFTLPTYNNRRFKHSAIFILVSREKYSVCSNHAFAFIMRFLRVFSCDGLRFGVKATRLSGASH